MATRTDYFRNGNSTDVLYALPLTPNTWSDTLKIDGDDSAQPTLYVFNDLDDLYDYEVFIQEGAEPVEGDISVAVLPSSGASSGSSGLPGAQDVRLGIIYGDSSQFEGNLVLPNTSEVLSGVGYGSEGTELVGQLQSAGGVIPIIDDVRDGVEYGTSLVGILQLPTPGQVERLVGYGAGGTEYYGTYQSVSSGGSSHPVNDDGSLDSPLLIGNAYIATFGTAFVWRMSPIAGIAVGDVIAMFEGRLQGCCNDGLAWTQQATVEEVDGVWVITAELSSEDTSTITAGDYQWWVAFALSSSEDLSIQFMGVVAWMC